MKVAFDVKGTLQGGGDKVHKLFKWFESKGCKMIIWSSFYDYAIKAQKKFGYDASIMEKLPRLLDEDLENNPNYNIDIAIDDNNFIRRNGEIEPIIACNHMIAVDEIPEDESKFEEFYGHLLKGEKL